jgi:hypothetical protein
MWHVSKNTVSGHSNLEILLDGPLIAVEEVVPVPARGTVTNVIACVG